MNHSPNIPRVAAAFGVGLLLAGSAVAADLYVGPDAQYQTIQAAIDAAGANDVIHVAEGVYDTGDSTVYRDTPTRVKIDGKGGLRIVGAGRGKTIIRGTRPEGLGDVQSDEAKSNLGSPCRCVHVANATGVQLRDLTLECGETRNSLSGGGICLKNATACLVDCEIRNCAAGYGGGAAGGDNGITLVRTVVTDTLATTDGGAVTGGVALVNCVFARTATTGSGAVVSGSTLYNCTLADNKATTALGSASLAYNSVIVLSSSALDASELSGDSTASASVLGSTAEGGHFQVAAPTLGDFRLLAGSPAVTAGLASNLEGITLPDGVSALVDVYGQAIVADGAGRIAAGAIQTPMTPAAGRLVFTNAVHTISGMLSRNASQMTWVYPEAYPTQYQVTAVPSSGQLLRWQRSVDNNFTYPSWRDRSSWIMPPPTVGEESIYTATIANNVYYVKPDGNDSNNGTSTNTAWRTLSKAASTPNAKYPAVVNVLPGTYAPDVSGNTFTAGGKTYGGNSIFAVDNPNLAFVAAEGPERTVIVGMSCTDGNQIDSGNYPGCGSGALKIAVLRRSCALVGFTLTGGRSESDGDQGVVQTMSAGGDPALQECIISNNVSMSYGTSAKCSRCRVVGNVSKNDTLGEISVQCEVRDNVVRAAGCGAIRGTAVFCTAVGTPLVGGLLTGSASVNSIWDGGYEIPSQWSGIGSVCWNYSRSSTSSDFVAADPYFVSRATSAKLYSVSPAVGAAVAPTAENCAGTRWYLYLGADMYGDPIRWTDGTATAGAVQSATPGALLGEDVRGGYAYDGGSEGVVALEDVSSFSVRPAAGTRPCIGVEVNGALRPFTNHWSDVAGGYVIPVDASDAVDGTLKVVPVYANDWYADDDGDDANSGFLPKLAKKTLATAEAMLAEGDTLRVLPGTYNAGSNRVSSTETIWSRLVVGSNHAVVSTDGPESTFIVGANASSPDEYGCGVDALRCVTVRQNGTFSGFTLTGGRVNRSAGANDQAGIGAGVVGEKADGRDPSYRMVVENCIISNCVAAAGGGAARVQLVRSRVFENTATSYGSAAYQTGVYSCFMDNNKGAGVVDHSSIVVETTVGGGNRRLDDAVPNAVQAVPEGGKLINSLLLQPLQLTEGNSYTISHCAIPDTSSLAGNVLDGTCIVTDAANLDLEGNGRPKVGVNLGIDKGSRDGFVDEYAFLDPEHDLSGFQRVMNGAMDIGCYEGDWSSKYARDLGDARHVSLSGVSSNVVEIAESKKVFMPSSSALTLTWAAEAGTDYPRTLKFVVTSGTLSVLLDGGEATVYTASPAEQSIVLSGDATKQLCMAVSEDGAATLLSCLRNSGMVLIYR